MKTKTSLKFLFAIGALAAFRSPAGADSVAVFYTGGTGYSQSIQRGGNGLCRYEFEPH
jgi:hypothetical protein